MLDSLALDATLLMDPSFVDIGHPGDPFPRVPPKDTNRRKLSVPTTSTTMGSKQRLASTQTSAPPQASSKPRQRHKSAKSAAAIDDDLLLDLLKEFRSAKQREWGAGSMHLSLGVKSLLSHGSYRRHPQSSSSLSDPQENINSGGRLPPLADHRGPEKRRERAASTASAFLPSKLASPFASSTSESILMLLQQLQAETARANVAQTQTHEVMERMRVTAREKAEAEGQLVRVREELGLYKVQFDAAQKGSMCRSCGLVTHNCHPSSDPFTLSIWSRLDLVTTQTDLPLTEILRAQGIVDNVDRQRILAEKEAARNRERLRRVLEDRLVQEALEEGRREGYDEGIRKRREVEDERRRFIAQEEQWDREQEREYHHTRDRVREREREEREKEKQAAKERHRAKSRGRARSSTLGSVVDTTVLKHIAPPRPPTAAGGGPSSWPAPPRPRLTPTCPPQPLPERQGALHPYVPSWLAPIPPVPVPVAPILPPAHSATPRIPYPPHPVVHQYHRQDSDSLCVPDTGLFAPLLPRPTVTTPMLVGVPDTQPQMAPAPASMHPPQRRTEDTTTTAKQSNVGSGAKENLETSARRQAKSTHALSENTSPTTATAPQSQLTKGQVHDPHFERVGHPVYVPPPDNYIPVMGEDGVVGLPPPHELGRGVFVGEGGGGHGTPGARRNSISEACGGAGQNVPVDTVRGEGDGRGGYGYTDVQPIWQREREKMGGEVVTPTPVKPESLPGGYVMGGYPQSKSKGQGKSKGRMMHVVNGDTDTDVGIARPSSSAGQRGSSAGQWNGLERPKTVAPLGQRGFSQHPVLPRPRLRGVSLGESQRELGGAASPAAPIPPGLDSLAAPSRSGGAGSEGWDVAPEDRDRKPLVRTMTSGTTPEIGVEPPSQSPTSAGDTLPMNPVFLTPNAVREVIPPNTTPQSYQEYDFDDRPASSHRQPPPPAQLGGYYGRPQFNDDQHGTINANAHDLRVGYFAAPPFPANSGWFQDRAHRAGSGGFDFTRPIIASTLNSNFSNGLNSTPRSPSDDDDDDEEEEEEDNEQDGDVGRCRTPSEKQWAPPLPVALSPIPAITNLDKLDIQLGGSVHLHSSPTPSLGKDGYVYGRPGRVYGVGDGNFLSPAPLNRPISLFEDSE